MKMLHLADKKPWPRLWVESFVSELKELGELAIVEDAGNLSEEQRAELIRETDVLLTGWGSAVIPKSVASDPGKLRYVCNATGSVRPAVPVEIVDAGIPLTNWGDAPAGRLAEGAFTLMLACIKNLRRRIEWIGEGNWPAPDDMQSLILEDLSIGVFGCGVIGRRFVQMLKGFGCEILVFDPYVDELPDGCENVESLDELFERSQVLVIHAGLSDETRQVVNAKRLAKLPDGGIVINTARGGIVDQDALFAELRSGRLIAGLDVLEPDTLPADHEARQWPNVIFTAHDLGKARTGGGGIDLRMENFHRICLDNLRRYKDGQELRFVMDRVRYDRST